MPIITSNTWKDYFISLPAIDDANANMAAHATALAAEANNKVKLSDLLNDIDGIILYAEDDRIKALHSLKNFGGSRMRPANKVAALAGFGPEAQRLLIDVDNALSACKLKTPTMTTLSKCTTTAEIEALPTPANGAAFTFKGSTVFIVAPWFWNSIIRMMEDADGEPFDMIAQAFVEALAFDLEREAAIHPPPGGDGEETKDNGLPSQAELLSDEHSATCHAGTFAMWAWGVKKRAVEDLRIMMRPGDTELLQYDRDRHQLCILPTGPAPAGVTGGGGQAGADVLSQLSANLSK
jgi:hypothetical protein